MTTVMMIKLLRNDACNAYHYYITDHFDLLIKLLLVLIIMIIDMSANIVVIVDHNITLSCEWKYFSFGRSAFHRWMLIQNDYYDNCDFFFIH